MDNLSIPPEQNLKQPVIPPPPKINPMFIIGGLILIAIILTGGIFIGRYLTTSQNIPVKKIIPSPTSYSSPTATPTLDPTANWKTYTNDKHNFSFKYPSELLLEENCTLYAMGSYLTCLRSSDFSYLMSERQPGTNNPISTTKGFGLFMNQIVQDYPYELSTLHEEYKKNYDNVTLITISTTPMLKTSQNRNPGMTQWTMIHNKSIYRVFSPFDTNDYPIINQILSTFKFLDVTGKYCQSDTDCGSGYRCMVVAGNVPVDENGKEITSPKTCYPNDAALPQ